MLKVSKNKKLYLAISIKICYTVIKMYLELIWSNISAKKKKTLQCDGVILIQLCRGLGPWERSCTGLHSTIETSSLNRYFKKSWSPFPLDVLCKHLGNESLSSPRTEEEKSTHNLEKIKIAVLLERAEMAFCNMEAQLRRSVRSMEICCIRMKFTLCARNQHKIYPAINHD